MQCIFRVKSSGKCRAPDKAPLNLEIIINICQEEIKSALLQGKVKQLCSLVELFLNLNEFTEALDILNDGNLEQNTPNYSSRSKRDADEDLTNEERRVAGVR